MHCAFQGTQVGKADNLQNNTCSGNARRAYQILPIKVSFLLCWDRCIVYTLFFMSIPYWICDTKIYIIWHSQQIMQSNVLWTCQCYVNIWILICRLSLINLILYDFEEHSKFQLFFEIKILLTISTMSMNVKNWHKKLNYLLFCETEHMNIKILFLDLFKRRTNFERNVVILDFRGFIAWVFINAKSQFYFTSVWYIGYQNQQHVCFANDKHGIK